MATAVVLYGPKGAGKSTIAEILHIQYGAAHANADAVALRLLATGAHPHPQLGWLPQVEQEVLSALRNDAAVSVEATGAWNSDWQLADDLTAAGHRVVRVWVSAPCQVTLSRCARRTTVKAPVTVDEARWIHKAASEQARRRAFELVVDTGRCPEAELSRILAPIAALLPP